MALARTLFCLLSLFCLCPGGAAGAAGAAAAAQQELVELLQTPKDSYTNALILSKSQTTLFIRHAGGLATVKVRDLDKSTQLQLGYQLASEPAAAGGPGGEGDLDAGLELPEADMNLELDPRFEEIWEKAVWETQEYVAGLPPAARYAGLALAGVAFLFFSLCSHLICRKAGLPATPLVWVPWLQFIPLARAAGLSSLWFVGMLIPGLNLLGYCLWAFHIATARGKGQGFGWLLLIPGVNVLAFLLLAFSDAKDPKARGPRKLVVLNQPSQRRAA